MKLKNNKISFDDRIERLKDIQGLLMAGLTYTEVQKKLKCSRDDISTAKELLGGIETDGELIKSNIDYKKQTQRFMDSNRIERKSFREYARIDNAVSEFNKELIALLKEHSLSFLTKRHDTKHGKATGIFHLTDAHFNELVSLPNNNYDFTIASKRVKLFVSQAKRYFNLFKVKNVFVAMTGDLLNSDRRIDELLAQATNRAKATFLAVNILEQALLDLNQDFNVSVASVTGNESRIRDVMGFTDMVATDNYDFTIFETLKHLFRKSSFRFIEGDPTELVVEVGGKNILLLHGTSIGREIEREVQKIKGKYIAKGVKIDFVIFGHKHSCRCGDWYARGSSIVGANAFSDKDLQLESRASQNIHIIFENGWDSIKIDLQNTDGVEGYDIQKELEAYNAKSSHKKQLPEIYRVVA